MKTLTTLSPLLVTLLACSAMIDDGPGGPEGPEDWGDPQTSDAGPPEIIPPPLPSGDTLAPSGLTRLSALEYDRTLAILLEDHSRPARALLPEDARTPFDNDYEKQRASQALIEGAELLAQEATDRLLDESDRRDRVIGCIPTDVDDGDCLSSFVRTFGRRAFRRGITDEDVAFFVEGGGAWPGGLAMAIDFDDFYEGVRGILNIILQDPEFLYRVQIGTPHEDAGVFYLSDYEIATKLSFFLWGSTPDNQLLDRAAAGELQDPTIRLEEANRLLADPRAHERFALFHSMWLGYEKLYEGSELSRAMRLETQALMDRVLFTRAGPWQDLFRSEQTFVNEILANNYGLDTPSPDGAWVDYQNEMRRGLFSHGSFLAIGWKNGDTSPVMRGIAILRNAFCQEVLPAPPGVDTDQPPASEALCKPERYSEHSRGGCASCHAAIDPIGFGLENFDAQGRYRSHETDLARTLADESQCRIEGQGRILGVGEFTGPGGLGQLGLESGMLRSCFVNHVHRLITGRGDTRIVDEMAFTELDARLPEGDFTLVDLVAGIVGHETFGLRREERE